MPTVIALGTLALITDAVQARDTIASDSTQVVGSHQPPVTLLALMRVATTANQSYAGGAALLATLLILICGMAFGWRQHSLL